MRGQEGFTLVEMMLSVAMIAVLLAIGIPVYQTFQVKNDLSVAVINTVHSFRRAQVLARASDGDTSWGVKAQTGSVVIFKGASYTTRDTTYDETFDLPTAITPSGVTEVVYAKFTGDPSATGGLILTSTTGLTNTITVNAKGLITY
jgi:prepilin-type N-terminal cleavage/methylation domain-containing protein